jgi:hypothetical protein
MPGEAPKQSLPFTHSTTIVGQPMIPAGQNSMRAYNYSGRTSVIHHVSRQEKTNRMFNPQKQSAMNKEFQSTLYAGAVVGICTVLAFVLNYLIFA